MCGTYAQLAQMNEVIKEGILLKMSQQKNKLFRRNYKEQLFILTNHALSYYEQEKGKKKAKKGTVPTKEIYCVDEVEPEENAPQERKFPFQVAYDGFILYIFATDEMNRKDWLAALMEVIQGNNNLSAKYHKGFWKDGEFLCCGQTVRKAPGCSHWYKDSPGPKAASLPPVPSAKQRRSLHLPPIPESESSSPVDVVAVYNYAAETPGELSLVKGNRYVVLKKISDNLWKVRDTHGSEGFVLSNYLEEVKTNEERKGEMSRQSTAKRSSSEELHLTGPLVDPGFHGPLQQSHIEEYLWYVGNMSRVKTEQLLREKGKEGSFVVRDSSQKGVYTVSLFSCALEEVSGSVRHYLINMNADGLYYLAENHLFTSIPEMIEYHQHNAAGLLTRLRHPATETDLTPALAQSEWELCRDDMSLVKELGSGQFGMVHLGLWKGHTEVAIKMMKEGCMSSHDFIEEAQIMMKLKHPKLVRLHGVCTEGFPIYIVTEYVSNGSLLDFLRKQGEQLQPSRLLTMCLDACEAMAFLEEQLFIHRDLAARNCLVDKDLTIKVSDFGMARYVLDDQYTSSAGTKFPVKWSAPEVLNYTRFSSKSDVWAFGVLMWEVYSLGKQPYESYDNSRVAERVMQGYRLYRPQLATDRIYQVMKSCWHELPEERPNFQQLIADIKAIEMGNK